MFGHLLLHDDLMEIIIEGKIASKRNRQQTKKKLLPIHKVDNKYDLQGGTYCRIGMTGDSYTNKKEPGS